MAAPAAPVSAGRFQENPRSPKQHPLHHLSVSLARPRLLSGSGVLSEVSRPLPSLRQKWGASGFGSDRSCGDVGWHSTPTQGRGAPLRVCTGATSRAGVAILSCDGGLLSLGSSNDMDLFSHLRGPTWSALVRAFFPVSALPTVSWQGERRRALWSLPLLDRQ